MAGSGPVGIGVRQFTVADTDIPGLLHIGAKAVSDDRGTVREWFRAGDFTAAGIGNAPVWEQMNLTWTRRGAIRGLHGEATDKLVGVVQGEAFAVHLDARPGSPTFGRVATVTLTVGVQLFVPAGVCNGFQALSAEGCQYLYCFTSEWSPDMAGVSVNPLDPKLGIDWPLGVDAHDRSLLSAKDADAPAFAALRPGG